MGGNYIFKENLNYENYWLNSLKDHQLLVAYAEIKSTPT